MIDPQNLPHKNKSEISETRTFFVAGGFLNVRRPQWKENVIIVKKRRISRVRAANSRSVRNTSTIFTIGFIASIVMPENGM